jgi:hypothetical protein
MVEMYSQRYCGSCKVMALKGQPLPEMGIYPCKEATTSLTLAIIAACVMFCPLIGFILAGVSLSQAQKASQQLNSNPQLMGAERVRAARIIAITAMVVAVILFVIDRVARTERL